MAGALDSFMAGVVAKNPEQMELTRGHEYASDIIEADLVNVVRHESSQWLGAP